ncbi:beta-glucosidase 4-like [Zingiber officinale]|uniref:beta-glucosidase 4-like n=1 Tax=Zingiber officinale TaxID=94328 RepID=UPI001C4ACB26|nr:beta-glucosidase 4-like [Zingiber officinale]
MASSKVVNGGVKVAREVTRRDFPGGFVFGSATSAYQVEGARREGGKGDSIWDIFSGKKENIKDGCNGDIAVDQYHRFKEDVELMCILGFGAYRFSIAWTRIFPDELGSKISEDGVAYYNSLIDFLLEKGIQPYATLYHWDLPNILHESIGGWLSENIVQYFALYAEVCFEKFGDRVKHWITINEPRQTAINGYGYGVFAPGRHQNSSVEPYLAAHYQLLAHAAAVSVYQKKFKDTQGGLIGLVVDCEWAEPFSDKLEDKLAAERWLDFQLGWYLDPIYHGEYPLSMRERVGDQLPKFSEADKELLRNSTDFIGLNHYTTKFVRHVENTGGLHFYRVQESHITAIGSDGEAVGARAASEWLYIVPWGLRKLLNYIAKRYHNPSIYITENGMDQEETETASLEELLDDQMRVDYYKTYLRAVADAIKDGVDVRGYFAWSFLDNFEWAEGYTKRFGMVYIDYKNGLTRYPKSSALWFSHFLKDSEEDCGKKVDQE